MVDGWMGDDWFHNGAFREENMSYVYEQEATRDNTAHWWSSHFDDYDMFMDAGSAGEFGQHLSDHFAFVAETPELQVGLLGRAGRAGHDEKSDECRTQNAECRT